MNKTIRTFFRSMAISCVIIFCISAGFYGMAKAYENTVEIGFGQYKKAVEITEKGFRLFDFEIIF